MQELREAQQRSHTNAPHSNAHPHTLGGPASLTGEKCDHVPHIERLSGELREALQEVQRARREADGLRREREELEEELRWGGVVGGGAGRGGAGSGRGEER